MKIPFYIETELSSEEMEDLLHWAAEPNTSEGRARAIAAGNEDMEKSTLAKSIPREGGVTLTSRCCHACYRQGKRSKDLISFSMVLCEQEDIFPVSKIPFYKQKLRGMVRRHYKEFHSEQPIK